MKRIISLLLAVILLCTPAAALDLRDVVEQVKDSEAYQQLFDSEAMKDKTAQLIEALQGAHEQIKAMSDEELRSFIVDTAAQYHIPEMNEEQINFLMDVCRSFESMEKMAKTLKDYEQKLNNTVETAKSLIDTIGKLMDKLNEIMEVLNNILSIFGGSDEAPAEAA